MDENSDSISENAEMLDVADQPSFMAEPADISMKSRSVSSRGRKRIPLQWCRVVSMELDSIEEIVIASINVDQQLQTNAATRPIVPNNKGWAPLFFTDHFLHGRG